MLLTRATEERLETLKHDVLRYRLFDLAVAAEFGLCYTTTGGQLSRRPIPDYAHLKSLYPHFRPPRDATKTAWTPSPLFLTIIDRALLFPFLQSMGPEYIATLRRMLTQQLLALGEYWQRATRFDLLIFVTDVFSWILDIRDRHWDAALAHESLAQQARRRTSKEAAPASGSLASAKPPPTTATSTSREGSAGGNHGGPATARSSLFLPLLAERQNKLGVSTRFRRAHVSPHPKPFDRAEKMLAFAGALEAFFALTMQYYAEARNRPGACSDQLFKSVAESPTVADLPALHREALKTLSRMIAHLVDNVLDDDAWRHKMTGIFQKMPVGLILTSLRMINPSPFVERVLKLFLWRPLGMQSLLQKLGTIVCAYDQTIAALKVARSKVATNEACYAIESLVAKMSLTEMDSAAPQARVERLLHKINLTATKPNCLFLRLTIRKREKDKFVEILGDAATTDLIQQIARSLPPMLSELYKAGDLPAIVKELFDLVQACLDALARYDQPDPDWRAIVDHLHKLVVAFTNRIYPLIRQTMMADKATSVLVQTFAFAIDQTGGVGLPHGHTCLIDTSFRVDEALAELTAADRVSLDAELTAVVSHIANGVPERKWEPMRILEGKVIKSYLRMLLTQIAGPKWAKAVLGKPAEAIFGEI